jgi:large subunit ribosomal protein L14
MVQKGSYLNVIDNSGVKQICCIHLVGGYRKRYAQLGDLIIASVKSIRFKDEMKLKKGDIVTALVLRTKVFRSVKMPVESSHMFYENAAVLLNNKNKPYGTRIFGGIQKHFRYTKYSKLLSLSSGIIK